VLVQSVGFASPKDAGQLIARLKREGGAALRHLEAGALHLGDELIGHLHDAAELGEVIEALAQLAEEA
jgi:tryptophanyl-tRNA synthetase